MSVTPSGSPAWVRNVSHEQYGGHTDKQNYQSQGVVNALTDVGADEFVRMAADLAACVRTTCFARFVIQLRDTLTLAPRVQCTMMTGISSGIYEGDVPPAGFPEVTRIADGRCNIDFETSYTDEYGVSADFPPIGALTNGTGSTPLSVTSETSNGNVVIHVKDSGGYSLDKTVIVEVF